MIAAMAPSVTPAPAPAPAPGGLGPALELAAAEIDRHAVRLVVMRRAEARVELQPFAALPALLAPGDLLIVNDAATLPASLAGRTDDGEPFELRLSAPIEGRRLIGVTFGRGDWRTRTEHRPPPPPIERGDRVHLATMTFVVRAADGRRVELEPQGATADEEQARAALWHAVYAGAVPVQYAHRRAPLPLWSVQTAYAARPWAVEMPSAGRPLTWATLLALRRRGIGVAALTHAAGLGSIGDAALDASLPWPERYELPARTAAAIAATRAAGRRVIAVGTTVVRALEASGGQAGAGRATLRLDAGSRPRIADGLVSGLHVPGESHFELLRAFAPADLLARGLRVARAHGLSAHELGDACIILP